MTTLNSAGQVVDLCENGPQVPVTYANLDNYIDKCV